MNKLIFSTVIATVIVLGLASTSAFAYTSAEIDDTLPRIAAPAQTAFVMQAGSDDSVYVGFHFRDWFQYEYPSPLKYEARLFITQNDIIVYSDSKTEKDMNPSFSLDPRVATFAYNENTSIRIEIHDTFNNGMPETYNYYPVAQYLVEELLPFGYRLNVTAPVDITIISDQRHTTIDDIGTANATGSHGPFTIFKNNGYNTYSIGETIVTWYAVDTRKL